MLWPRVEARDTGTCSTGSFPQQKNYFTEMVIVPRWVERPWCRVQLQRRETKQSGMLMVTSLFVSDLFSGIVGSIIFDV